MQVTENDIKQINRTIKRVGNRYDGAQIDDELHNGRIIGTIRNWSVPKETIDQTREGIEHAEDEMEKVLRQALRGHESVDNVILYHGDKNYFDFEIILK